MQFDGLIQSPIPRDVKLIQKLQVRSEHRPGKTKVPFLDIRVHPTYILGSSFYLAVSTYIYNSAIKNLHASLMMPSKIHDAHHSWILSTS